MTSTEANVRNFFASSASAAVGASSHPANFGHRVCAWYLYLYHDLPVTPINPRSATIPALEKDHPTVPSVAALPNPKQTSITVITPLGNPQGAPGGKGAKDPIRVAAAW
ncbi:ADIPOR-like receptor SPBC12C2.09c [Fusarium oxysporum f. sp. albedinis]|nr:ADIPOR-like receptor SPBC12C2.09c [Fusarium oxysporum f. sp. albedinis]